MKRLPALLFCAFLIGSSALAQPPAQSTAFTYQGHLTSGSGPANGNFDMTFTLFSQPTGGNQVGSSITALQYPIANGLFTIDLNFPGAFTGYQLWLETTVSGQVLTPRQAIASVPVAQFALTGVIGPPGPPGDQGVPGPPGVQGPQGSIATPYTIKIAGIIVPPGAGIHAEPMCNKSGTLDLYDYAVGGGVQPANLGWVVTDSSYPVSVTIKTLTYAAGWHFDVRNIQPGATSLTAYVVCVPNGQ